MASKIAWRRYIHYLLAFVVCISSTIQSISAEIAGNNETIDPSKFRLPANVIPINYKIKIIPHITGLNFTFDGEVDILVDVLSSTENLTLNALNMTIHENATSLRLTNSQVVYKPIRQLMDAETEFLLVFFGIELTPGKYTLHLEYTGVLNDAAEGFYKRSYINENGKMLWLAVTSFETSTARHAFPCWDEPALKSTFAVSVKHYPNYTAVGNTPVLKQDFVKHEGKQWTHFQTTPLMSTYLVAFLISDYGNLSAISSGVTVRYWSKRNALSNLQHAFEIGQKVLTVLGEYTDIAYSLPKMDNFAIPKYPSGAIENWGIISYEELYLLSSSNSTVQERQYVTRLIAHESAHQWFGNLVSPAWWSDVWLSEGFATYMECIVSEKIEIYKRICDYCTVENLHMLAMTVDTNVNKNTPLNVDIRNVNETTKPFDHGVITYSKASVILRMVSHMLSDEIFLSGVRKYLHVNQYKSVTPNHLWTSLQETLDQANVPHGNFRIEEMMNSWINNMGYPVVTATRDYFTGSMSLTQKRFVERFNRNIPDVENVTFWIPVNFATESNSNFSITVASHWMNPKRLNLVVDGINNDDWVILNIQNSGYYRVNYDEENWEKIARYMKTDNYVKIHPMNRAQLINDGCTFMKNGDIRVELFLDFFEYLRREVDYLPWFVGFSCFNKMRKMLSDLSDHPDVQKYFLTLMKPIIEDMKFEVVHDEDYTKVIGRLTALKWAVDLKHRQTRERLMELHTKYQENTHKKNLSTDIKYAAYCAAIFEGSEDTWNDMFQLYMESPGTNGNKIDTLTCVEQPALVKKYLKRFIENADIPKEHLMPFVTGILKRSANGFNLTLEFISENKDALIDRAKTDLESITAIITDILRNKITTKDEIEQVKIVLEPLKTVFQDAFEETLSDLTSRTEAQDPREKQQLFESIKKHLQNLQTN